MVACGDRRKGPALTGEVTVLDLDFGAGPGTAWEGEIERRCNSAFAGRGLVLDIWREWSCVVVAAEELRLRGGAVARLIRPNPFNSLGVLASFPTVVVVVGS